MNETNCVWDEFGGGWKKPTEALVIAMETRDFQMSLVSNHSQDLTWMGGYIQPRGVKQND